MQLSNKARKAVAAGLAASTILWAGVGAIPQIASAAVHSDGCVVLSGGVVWLITNGTRRGFTSAEVFQSSGYNFSQVVGATAEDVALPVGPIMTYADGTLVKGPSDPLVYLVTGGQKRGFTSGSVFIGRGFSFANIQLAPYNTFADLPTGANINETVSAHGAGVLVNSNGTIWWMTSTGRMGFPSMAVFQSYGLMLSHVVSANAADLVMPDQGAVQMRAGCSGGGGPTPPPPPPSGAVSVSLASDNPAPNTVVAGQSTADLAHFLFSGSGAVTQLTLQRIGVSSNTALTNVYLFNGNLRITDASSVNSNGQIVFSNASGLFTAPATISVRADIAPGISGQTVGVAVVSGMSGSNPISGQPSGNLFTVANPGNLATAVFQANTVPAGNVNAGSLNYTVWSAPLSIGNRSVWLKTAMFRVIGSANADALTNWVLYVDGNQVATAGALQSINGSNYAVFTPGNPFSIATGSHTLEVRADIVKGSGRNVTVSLQNAADIMLTDSSFNVNITPNTTNTSTVFSPNSAGQLSIQNGVVSVQLDPTFNSVSTVSGGATNVPLAKFNMTAYGEDVQINTLVVTFSGSAISAGLNNVALYANGSQVGSTQQLGAGATTVTFNLGSSLIIPAGSTTNLSVQADTINAANANITSGTIQVSLVAGGANVNNAQGRSSQNTLSVPTGTVTANSLTVGAGGLVVAKNAAYTNQTLTPNAAMQKIGSFTLQAGTSESIRVTNLNVALMRADGTTPLTNTATPGSVPALTNFSNLKVAVNGGAPSQPVPPQASNNFSQNNFVIPANGTATVDVYADLGTDSSGAQFTTVLTATANGVTSNTSASSGAVVGQLMTLQAGALSAPTFTTASSSPSMYIAAAGGAVDGSNNSFNLSATSGTVNVSELKFVVNNATPGVVPNAGVISFIKVNGVSAPVITPTPTTLTVSSTLTTGSETLTVASTANLQVGSVITIQTEDMVVTAVPSATTVTVTHAVDGTTGAPHTAVQTVNIHGLADLNGLNLSVPNGSGGIYVNALPTYGSVGTTGIPSDTTSRIALTFTKSTSGSTTTSAAVTPVQANPMDSVGSKPNLSATTTNNAGLQLGENKLYDLTITPDPKGNVQINTIVYTVTGSGITGTPQLTAARLAVGSTTITGSACTGGFPATLGTVTVTCTLPPGYVLTAGVAQTISLYGTVAGTLGAAGTSSVTTSLAPPANFSWTDVAGTGVVFTTQNTTYLNNYPTQTWSVHN